LAISRRAELLDEAFRLHEPVEVLVPGTVVRDADADREVTVEDPSERHTFP
jgi:hypothetical protein